MISGADGDSRGQTHLLESAGGCGRRAEQRRARGGGWAVDYAKAEGGEAGWQVESVRVRLGWMDGGPEDERGKLAGSRDERIHKEQERGRTASWHGGAGELR